MKKTIPHEPTPKEWDPELLYNKAQLFAERMIASSDEDGEKALWSALTLEMLARAALANVSPTLLVDPKVEGNLEHSLGLPVKVSKFRPISLPIEKVLSRLNSFVPDFVDLHREFCVGHMGLRNAEVHSGASPFESLRGWEGPYFGALAVLLASIGHDLNDLLGEEQAAVAKKQIEAHADKGAKAVKKDVELSLEAWRKLGNDEKAKRLADAEVWATRQSGHRAECPACKSPALIIGEAAGSPERSIDGDFITEAQTMLPRKFECIACGLKISGLAKLNVVGLGEKYKSTKTYDAYELYANEDDPMWGYEEDNNEPF